MKMNLWKRFGILLLAMLLGLMLIFTGCAAEDVDLALDIADAVIDMALEEQNAAETAQKDSTPESSQSPPEITAPPEIAAPAEEAPAAPDEALLEESEAEETVPLNEEISEDGRYTSPEDVALYIHTYGKLPKNFITKNKARDLGWDSKAGNLWDVTDQMSIGGDRFGNYEGLLPDAKGRTWKECDVNYEGGYRGSERILYSNDGLIYYTDDHYKTFTKLY